jgi:hypothetical protein
MKLKLQPIPSGTLLNPAMTPNSQPYNDKFSEPSDKKPTFIPKNIFHEKLRTQKKSFPPIFLTKKKIKFQDPKIRQGQARQGQVRPGQVRPGQALLTRFWAKLVKIDTTKNFTGQVIGPSKICGSKVGCGLYEVGWADG